MRNRSETTLIMVDDNVDEIFLTRRQVRKDGIVNRFISEQNPENLLDVLDDLKKQGQENVLILLDVAMPRLNGMDLLKQLRERPEYASTPVIMLSASDEQSDIAQAASLGADGYIVKPLKAETFFAILKNVPSVKQCLVQ